MERIHPRSYKPKRKPFVYTGRHRSRHRPSGPVFNDLLVVEDDPVTCDASDHLKARLVKAVRLLRLYDAGRLPLKLMRALDRIKWEVPDGH